MNFKTHNQKEVNTDGTFLIGEINADYNQLKKMFGEGLNGDGYKIDAEWEIEFENGQVATIYNYKNGKNYLGKNGLPKTKITNWHVGGKNESVLKLIEDVLKINCFS